MRLGTVLTVCFVAATLGCGNKAKDKDEDKPKPRATATTGAESPKAVMEALKLSVGKGDLKRAMTLVRVREHAVFVGLAYLDVAMPVVLKLGGADTLQAKYDAINRKHNLVIDEKELTRVAQTRRFAELHAYFTRVFKGNDLLALWTDVHAAVPKERVVWSRIEVHRVTPYGKDKAKVELSIKGVDSTARFDVIKQNGRWYFDVGAFGKNQEPPKGTGLNPPGSPNPGQKTTTPPAKKADPPAKK